MQRTQCLLAATLALIACGGGETAGPGDSTPIARLELRVPADTLLVRETSIAAVTARGANGAALADRPLTWSSTDSTVLSISPGGTMTALRGGTVTLGVASGGVSASHAVVVRTLRFASVYTGPQISCGLESTGDLWCWGNVPASGYGNGSGKGAPSLVPRRAAAGHHFTAVSLGPDFACGIELGGGSVVCWGGNAAGQLGDGTRTPHFRPAAVSGAPTATAVVTGVAHACAVSAAGAVFCWGSNALGQLGDGTRQDRLTPVQVPGLSGVSSLAAGDVHTCAVAPGGTVCWGSDQAGELGHDTTYDRLTPVRAGATAEFSPSYSSVSASYVHSCGLVAGEVYCWGSFGGDGFRDPDTVALAPVPAAPGHQFVRLADGIATHCGLESGGDAWCWIFGQVPVRYPSPVPLVDITVSEDIACAADTAGATTCWNPRDPPGTAPATVVGAPAFVRLATGEDVVRACGMTAAGAVWCWHPLFAPLTAELTSGSETFSSIWSGFGEICALTAAGDVWCHGHATFDFVPTAVGYSITQVTTGRRYGCGITATGAALCWGTENGNGQLGDGTRVTHATPAPVAGGLVFTSIAAGVSHTCGGTAAGSIYCWGRGYDGEMGDGTGPFSQTPLAVSSNPSFTTIHAGGRLTCGLGAGGAAVCWAPQRTINASLTQVAVGDNTACGLDQAGGVSCWTGDAQTPPVPLPPGAPPFATIAGGGTTKCAITAAGATWCWGGNTFGNIGSPDAVGVSDSDHPMRVYGQE